MKWCAPRLVGIWWKSCRCSYWCRCYISLSVRCWCSGQFHLISSYTCFDKVVSTITTVRPGHGVGGGVEVDYNYAYTALLQLLFFVLLFFKDSSLTVHPILCDPEVSMDFCSTGHKANGKVFFIKFFHVYFNLTSKLWFPYNQTWRYPFSFIIVGKVIWNTFIKLFIRISQKEKRLIRFCSDFRKSLKRAKFILLFHWYRKSFVVIVGTNILSKYIILL